MRSHIWLDIWFLHHIWFFLRKLHREGGRTKVSLQWPFLKLMIKVCQLPDIAFSKRKIAKSYCELGTDPRTCRWVPVISQTQRPGSSECKRGPNRAPKGHRLHEIESRSKGEEISDRPPLPNDCPWHQSSSNQPERRLKIWSGIVQMLAGSQGMEKKSGSNYIQFWGMWGILMISITPVVILGGGAH